MTKRNRSHDKRLAVAKCMPPLRRKEPGGDYAYAGWALPS